MRLLFCLVGRTQLDQAPNQGSGADQEKRGKDEIVDKRQRALVDKAGKGDEHSGDCAQGCDLARSLAGLENRILRLTGGIDFHRYGASAHWLAGSHRNLVAISAAG